MGRKPTGLGSYSRWN